MAKQPKQDETIQVLYGISRKTFEVRMIFLSRDGVLSSFDAEGVHSTHAVLYDRKPESEARLAFELTDVVSFPIGMIDGDHVKRVRKELEEKAAEMKKAAEAAKP